MAILTTPIKYVHRTQGMRRPGPNMNGQQYVKASDWQDLRDQQRRLLVEFRTRGRHAIHCYRKRKVVHTKECFCGLDAILNGDI